MPADHKCSGERTTKICNKFYNWKISTGNLSTIDETTFDKRQYIGLVEV